jgi:hypothetical protein
LKENVQYCEEEQLRKKDRLKAAEVDLTVTKCHCY